MVSSVLLVPGDQFGLDKGIWVGFCYDIKKTLKGLTMIAEISEDSCGIQNFQRIKGDLNL
jgi:hypothetical protein